MPLKKAKCSKIAYKGKTEALQDIIYIKNQQKFHSKKYVNSKKAGQKMQPYECKRCGYWHLTVNVKYKRSAKRIKK